MNQNYLRHAKELLLKTKLRRNCELSWTKFKRVFICSISFLIRLGELIINRAYLLQSRLDASEKEKAELRASNEKLEERLSDIQEKVKKHDEELSIKRKEVKELQVYEFKWKTYF